MSLDSINALSAANPALVAQQRVAAALDSAAQSKAKGNAKGTTNDPAAIKKAASQFEAIILRQLLTPAIEPVMSGGLGGGEKSSGGGVYGYMLTDVLADNLSKGGGLGLAKMLEKQFTPHAATNSVTSSSALSTQSKSPITSS